MIKIKSFFARRLGMVISLTCLFLMLTAIATADDLLLNFAKKPAVTFQLIKNHDDSTHFFGTLSLKNLSALTPGKHYILAFNSVRPITSVDQGRLTTPKQGGDLYFLHFTLPKQTDMMRFHLKGQYFVKKHTDAPTGYFLIVPQTNKVIPLQGKAFLPPWQPKPGDDEISRNKRKANTAIEGNPIDTPLTAATSIIVPLPVSLQRHPGEFVMTAHTRILYQTPIAQSAALFFAKAIQPSTGLQLAIQEHKETTSLLNAIVLTTDGATLTANQQKEGYLLDVTPTTIFIRAQTERGFFYGLQSLRQLLPPVIYSNTLQHDKSWTIPTVSIRDYPRFEYRGMHLDSVRHFIAANEVKRLLDLMAIHKLNYFEWHLTDDEGWRIEIKRYPSLTTKGAWRSYSAKNNSASDLLPTFGSGPKSYGGFYSQDDIRDIVRYAKERHITIIPEIDMPGHARAMIMSLPNELIDKDDQSAYTSIQGYHDNILSPCKKETFIVIDNILTEIANLFPTEYIHVGGDEVPTGAWTKSCMANQFDPQDPHFRDKVQNYFMKKVQAIIQSKGKIMAGWEEVANDQSTLNAPLRVYIWNASKINQAYKKSEKEGYEVIMAPAENLYFDLAYHEAPHEPGQYWAGHVDTFSAYSLTPIDPKRGHSEVIIKGVQGQLWSEVIDSPERLDYLAFPKIAGLAELAWSPANRRNWKHFDARMRELHVPRLDAYGVKHRKLEFTAQ